MSWDHDDVERLLNKYPLPRDFEWNGEKVWPRYRIKKGWGFWLRTAGSYHPALRGLYNLIAEIIIGIVEKEFPLPTPEELALLLLNEARRQADLPLFEAPDPQDRNPTITQR